MTCDDQAELDRYWDALLDGGTAEAMLKIGKLDLGALTAAFEGRAVL